MFKAVADGHDFAGGFHLGAQGSLSINKFVKGPAREFDNNVVNHGFKTGRRLAGDVIDDFIEAKAHGDQRGHFGDGITRRLGGQSRGARHPGVDFDDGVVEILGIQGELTVAAPFHAEGGDDFEGRGAKHLVFFVGQGLTGSDDDGVPGVNADGVKVFHGANGDDVALAVPHDFKLNFLPAGDAPFDEDLMNR